MRSNTYVKLESVYRKFKGYIGTKELLEKANEEQYRRILKYVELLRIKQEL